MDKNNSNNDNSGANAERKLVRIPEDGMISGVAAGFADYFNIDVTIMRLIFIAIIFATSGLAIIGYIILAVTMPVQEADSTPKTKKASAKTTSSIVEPSDEQNKLTQYAGIGLVVFGLWLLLSQVFPDVWKLQWDFLWPALIIVAGILIMTRSKK